MKRLNVTLMAAALMIAASSSASFAQYESPRPPDAMTAPSSSTAVPSDRDQRRAAKKTERENKRMACRNQAKQQGLKGAPMKDFLKTCMTP
jgi:hypothetical protein